jgi:methionyl-tRNA synthetase
VDKTWYVTTPIYYVNGRPHIGHAYTTVAADALARYHRARGQQVFFLTGTDEHGQKVLDKAVERGMTPIAHADDMVATAWRPTFERLGISNDLFMRTTRPEHVAYVQAALSQLHAAGQLYKDSYEGWYSPAAERFWTEKDLVDGKCPDTGLPVYKVEESNWFFKMGSWQQALLDHIEANPGFIRPAQRRNEVLGFLRKPLGDLCISRPKSRMSWGIEIPFDPDFVTYVWFDALLNYASGPGCTPAGAGAWPPDVQLLGKDILTTHAVYWTTMLLALGLALPKTLYAHGWWMAADGSKMSKSLGNAVDIELLVDAFGVDAVRYHLLRDVAFGLDGAFSYDGFLTRYNADLANDLGNLAHRGLSMVTSWLGGVVPAVGARTPLEERLLGVAAETVRRYEAAMEDFQLHEALEAVAALVRAGNKYVDEAAPWALNKAGDVARLGTVLRCVAELSLMAAVLLRPVMPAKCDELLAKLSAVDTDAMLQRWLAAGPGLAELTEGATLTLGEPLFPRHREMPASIAAALAAVPQESPVSEPEAPAAPKNDKLEKLANAPEAISYDDFAKVALRVGLVLSAEKHPKADRLLVLQVDLGEETPRQIVAGIADKFAPEALVGRKVVVVANLAPVKLRGIESRGMLLAAGGQQVVDLVSVNAEPGDIVR